MESTDPWFGRYGRLLAALLIFAATLSGVVAWHWLDRRVPQDDCANLACTALEIYQTWEDHGPIAGLKSVYLHSGWRPIILPNLTVALVFLFHGNVVQAASAMLVFFWILLYGFTFLCFRQHLGPILSAVCASFLTSLPQFFTYSCVFFAELPMLACLAAALYHAQGFHASKCKSLSQGVWLGFWIALALTLRPLEPIPVAGTIFLILAAACLRSGTLRWSDLFLAAASISVVVLILLLCALSRKPGWWALVGLVVTVGAHLGTVARVRNCMNPAFAASIAVVLSGVGLWYWPRMRGLCGWVWQCTIGDMAHLVKGNGSLTPIAAVGIYLRELGGWQLFAAALVSAIVLIFAYKRRPIAGGYFMVIGAAQVILVLVLTSLMETSDLRRGLAGFYDLFLGLTIFAVGGGAVRFAWLRILPIAGFALLQTTLIWLAATGATMPSVAHAVSGYVGAYMSASAREDENGCVFHQVQRLVPQHNAVCCLSLAVYKFEARAFCPYALNLLALANRWDARFGYPWDFRDLSEGYRQMEVEGYTYVLLDTRDAAPDIPEHRLQEPMSILSADMVRRSRDGSLAEVGWEERNTFYQGNTKLLILSKTTRR